MILQLEFINPINSQLTCLNIRYPIIDYCTFKTIKEYSNDADLIKILDSFLEDLDCTIEYDCGRPRMTSYPIYDIILSRYYFYLIKISNQFVYNDYVNKLIDRHIKNIIFEYENPYIKQITKRKRKVNKFVKYETYDLFTNEKKYIYYNEYTKKEIESTNPNLLEELNCTKKKEHKKVIKTKNKGVPISAMTFKFK